MLRRLALLLVPVAPFAAVGAAVVVFGPSSACVPPGNSSPYDAGTTAQASPTAPAIRPSVNVMTAPFEDSFERPAAPSLPLLLESGAADGAAAPSLLGAAWVPAGTSAWTIENGRMCGSKAKNHGVWLQRTLPVNARIEFDAVSNEADGDIKCEVWGDGRSAATGMSYTNATSYVVIFGGWHNTLHKIARLNEHGGDAKEIKVDKSSDDPVQQPVTQGQVYHFKIERTDGKTVRWSVNGVEYLAYTDPAPLTGVGHDHFGFNDWEAPVCFDNLKVTPLP
jgi:hypothetical protein